MGNKAGGMGSESDEEGGLEPGNNEKIPMTVARWLGKSQKGSVGLGDGEEGSSWGYDQVPSECRRSIDKPGIDSDSGPGGGKSGMLDGSVDE